MLYQLSYLTGPSKTVPEAHLDLSESGPAAGLALIPSASAQPTAAFERATERWAGGLPLLHIVDRAFTQYGATLCGKFFDVDALLAPGKGSGQLHT